MLIAGGRWMIPASAIWGRMKNNYVFGPFWELSFGVIADGHTNAHSPA